MVWHAHRELYHWGKDSVTSKLTEMCYFWPNMKAFVGDTLAECNFCRLKRRTTTLRDVEYHRKEIHPVNTRVYMDVFHACRVSNDSHPMLSMMDGTSRFAKAICLHNASATEVIRKFQNEWVVNFGCPREV